MTKRIIIGLVTLLLISCKKKSQESRNFELIDLSICNGWTDTYCLKVSNDGKTYISNDRHRKGEKYFHINIGAKEMDSISSLVKIVLSSKLDTIYERTCVDCAFYNLIIKTKDRKFKSFVDGIDYSNKTIDCMNKLTSFLYKIAEKSRNSIDSVCVFESRTKNFYPLPLKELIKFTPPEITDDNN